MCAHVSGPYARAWQVLGPMVGGALYDAGGYPLPFLVSGILFLLLGALTTYVGATTPIGTLPPSPSVSIWRLLRMPAVALMLSW